MPEQKRLQFLSRAEQSRAEQSRAEQSSLKGVRHDFDGILYECRMPVGFLLK